MTIYTEGRAIAYPSQTLRIYWHTVHITDKEKIFFFIILVLIKRTVNNASYKKLTGAYKLLFYLYIRKKIYTFLFRFFNVFSWI
jgi:hypothetical protein